MTVFAGIRDSRMTFNTHEMRSSWTKFLHASLAAQHGAAVYGSDPELADPVGAYLAAGFDLAEPALVVATPEHFTAFAHRLESCGWDATELERRGQLRCEDAAETLDL